MLRRAALLLVVLALAASGRGAVAQPQPIALVVEQCRAAGAPAPLCALLDRTDADTGGITGLGAPTTAIEDWQTSWAHRALGLQRALGDRLPLDDAEWIATHNSFNAAAYQLPTASGLDPNQRYPLADQLRMDVRSVELDVHWFPSAAAGGASTPLLCHAAGPHVGCTVERPLAAGLVEIAAWLADPASGDDVVLIDVEDHLDTITGYDTAAAQLDAAFGPLLHRPPADGACHSTPLDLTRAAMRAAGTRVLLTSGCGQGGAWPALVWSTDARQQSAFTGTAPYPTCGPLGLPLPGDGVFRRHWEDSTFLSSVANAALRPITPDDAATLLRCGVNMVSLDLLRPFDGRLEALVWSWAPGEPSLDTRTEACATFGPDGRLRAAPCTSSHPVACRDGAHGAWTVTAAAVSHLDADRACRAEGLGTSWVPATAIDAQHLHEVVGAVDVWVDYRVVIGTWTPEASG